MFYRFLTEEERNRIKELRQIYISDTIYEEELNRYLEKINYEERLEAYLDNTWYIKLYKWIKGIGRRKGNE